MRKKIVIGNWKMNTSLSEAEQLLSSLNLLSHSSIETAVLVPFLYALTLQKLAKTHINIGVQNVSSEENGAFTGEISAAMLNSCAINYVCIGHSERRTLFDETDEIIAKKLKIALKHDLKPIFCCGEPLTIRNNNTYLEYIEKQLTAALLPLEEEQVSALIIAYEPIWAIGTGETASAEQAEEAHLHIRQFLSKHYSEQTAQNITILYGGSVKADNAKNLFSQKNIDGALVGGASLHAETFVQIINQQHEL